jgi:hypothetical protein
MAINIIMTKVELHNINMSSVLNIVYNLRHTGYVQGVDFDFAYFPEKLSWDISSGDPFDRIIQTRRVEFYFSDEQAALIFKLKYND